MKLIPIFFFIILSASVLGQSSINLNKKPKTIEECFSYLDIIFDDTSKYTFMTLPEDVVTTRLHHGLGTWIRNNWGLWGNSDLKLSLIDSGFVHPDDMSAIILKAYHRHLNKLPLDINTEAEKYRKYWEAAGDGDSIPDLQLIFDKQTSSEELMTFFPVGDTIVVPVFAPYKKFFQTYADSVEGIAIVKAHKAGSLVIQLIQIEEKEKRVPKHKVNDEYEILPHYCSLIPPKGWNIEE